jgi:hypothetical protein
MVPDSRLGSKPATFFTARGTALACHREGMLSSRLHLCSKPEIEFVIVASERYRNGVDSVEKFRQGTEFGQICLSYVR